MSLQYITRSTNVQATNGFGPQLFQAAHYANIFKSFLISNRGIQCLSLNWSYSRIFKQVFREKYFHWL